VNDAFPDDHRAHASVTGVPALLPHYCGSALAKEIEHLKGAFTPELHSIAIIGGAKFETKEPLIRQLLLKYETVCLGGALANDLLKARGFPVGKSLIQDGGIPEDLKINQHLKHPIDVVVERAGASATCMIADVQAEDVIVDVGPQTVLQMKVLAEAAPLVVWNGPLGWYEKGYTQSSRDFGNILAYVKGETIIGGGDTIAVLDRDGFSSEKAFTFVSAGGGAMLDFLVEGTLPGIAALA
jgi:phosphoglycerate kinase